MSFLLAVANRKGGVGKSTVSVMLAHALSTWGNKRVLLLDLDPQCNASLILLGGQAWDTARKEKKTIADYFFDLFDENVVPAKDYLVHGVGDVAGSDGAAPNLSLLPGSLLLEDVQGEIFVKEARQTKNPDVVASRVRGRLEKLLKRFAVDFDVVIFDCAPGLSFAALAALKAADKVLVPFRPDYVSRLAVDRVSLIIEGKHHIDSVAEIPIPNRRYTCLANCVRQNNGRERLLIDEIELYHPIMQTRLPQHDSISDAFDHLTARRPIEAKYGPAANDLQKLYAELEPLLAA